MYFYKNFSKIFYQQKYLWINKQISKWNKPERKVEPWSPRSLTIKDGEISENSFLLLKRTSFINVQQIAFSKEKFNDIS